MDIIVGGASSICGQPTELAEAGNLGVDTGEMYLTSLIPKHSHPMDVGCVQSMNRTRPSPFGAVGLHGPNDIVETALAAAEASQCFGPSMVAADLAMGMDNIDGAAFDRHRSAPVYGALDIAPNHIKNLQEQACAKDLAVDLERIDNNPLMNTQLQKVNPPLRRLASESAVTKAKGYHAGQLQGSQSRVKLFLQQNGHTLNPSLSTPYEEGFLHTSRPTQLLESVHSTFPSTWTAGDGQSCVPKIASLPKRHNDRVHPKSRWKPTGTQLSLLEQHFNSGYTKPTPELFAAVQALGSATEAQVSVWLKNRLSRSKNASDKVQALESRPICTEVQEDGSPKTGIKRKREQEIWDDFTKISKAVIGELSTVAATIKPADAQLLAQAIKEARHICCYGVGREGLVMRALASNLHHLGLSVFFVGDIGMPVIGDTDLFLASAGPSYYSSVSALCLEAMRAGARVIAFTAHKTADLPFTQETIRIPSQTLPPCMPTSNGKACPFSANVVSFLPGGKWSIMHMGASYELSLWLMFECISLMLQKKLRVESSEMRERHTNLE